MEKLNRKHTNSSQPFPERVLQFGGGNFLRAFVNWMLDVYNEKMNGDLGVLLVTPIEYDNYTNWQEQEGLYHVLTRGLQNGEIIDDTHLVSCISRIIHLYPQWSDFLKSAENPDTRYIISNTTEAGIRFSPEDKVNDTPPREFPAKLTLWLYHRYRHFQGSPGSGCIFLPVELILKNGEMLRECILQNADNWGLEDGFKNWINEANVFYNTLVDRIVPGISRDVLPEEWEKLGMEDTMMTQGEPFHLWVIEGPEAIREELPLDKAGLQVIFTDDLSPYRTRKVRILNGAHTSMVPVGYLSGIETVREALEDEVVGKFINQVIFDEIIPTLDLPDEELQQFANDVLDRFRNPFIRHQLISISLNSVSKFKTRVLPSILEFVNRRGSLPQNLVFSMAALVRFYKGELNGKEIPLNDDPEALSYLRELWDNWDGSKAGMTALARQVAGWEYAWETNLDAITGFTDMLADQLWEIETNGVRKVLE